MIFLLSVFVIYSRSSVTHLDFLEKTAGGLGFLGGLVQMNATGTEYCFEQLVDYYADRFDDEKIIGEIAKADKVPFALASTARKMGEIFRVSKSAFNSGEDLEQEIERMLLEQMQNEQEMQKRNAASQALEDTKSDIGWGHQIRSYVLDASRIKDLRTNIERSDCDKVLDGDIDEYLEASLKSGP